MRGSHARIAVADAIRAVEPLGPKKKGTPAPPKRYRAAQRAGGAVAEGWSSAWALGASQAAKGGYYDGSGSAYDQAGERTHHNSVDTTRMPSAATAMNPAKYPARSPSNVVLRGYTEPVATVRGTSVTMPGGLGDSAVAGKSSHMHVPKNYRATSDSALPGSLVEPEGAPVATGTGKMRSAFPSDRTAQHIGALRHASDGSSSVLSLIHI